ncbi:MAG: hypothetical protein IT503_14220 [Burkholderiaceae bacterium]|nr:hypothetical protein [Burkholderiaceae bacterium]
MKLWAPVFCAVTLAAVAGASPAAEVGVSVQISQPGVYGRIDIGRFPQPQVVVAQPVLIAPPPVVAAQPPMYLWVPYGHRKHWRKHCHEYNACGVPVYFVRHDWYRDHVMVVARPDHHRNGKGKRGGRDHDDD